MARFRGRVGYASSNVATAPGVFADTITERVYRGNVIRDTRRISETNSVNATLSVSNSISIVADAYANEHYFAIRYVEWGGELWTVTTVDVERPRLILRLGEVYNGPTAN